MLQALEFGVQGLGQAPEGSVEHRVFGNESSRSCTQS